MDPKTGQIAFAAAIEGSKKPVTRIIQARVNGEAVVWISATRGKAAGGTLDMKGEFVRAGLLLSFAWQGRTTPRYPRLDAPGPVQSAGQ